MKQKKTTKGKASKKKIVIASVAIGVTGILGYFGWQYLKKKKQSSSSDIDTLLNKIQTPVANTQVYTALQPKISAVKKTTQSTTVTRNDTFPLKKGSKGDKVKQLQQALINRYGSSILPKYGADGDFGTETITALKKINMPDTITESMFNVLTQAAKTSTDAATVGKDLYKAAIAKNLNQAIALLKKLSSSDDYNTANEQFKLGRINGVRQTIVNGLLNSFTSAADKEKIKFEFLRIGLQYDGSKWSLSGIDGRPIVTSMASTVWLNAKESVAVPANMVLGNEVSRRLDYTLFENKGNYFLVESKSVRYL